MGKNVVPGIAARRKALGLSLRAAAGGAGVSYETWRNWERGAITPRADDLLAAARVLGCAVEDLYEDFTTEEEVMP